MNLTNITMDFQPLKVLSEFDIISKYCSGLDDSINSVILLLTAIYILIFIIEIIESTFNIDLFSKQIVKGYYNVLIIPLIWVSGRILIYQGIMTENIMSVIKIFTVFIVIIIIIIAWHRGYIKKFIKYLERIKDDDK